MSSSQVFSTDNKPKFPFDDDFRNEEDWDIDDSCPNCKEPLSEHTDQQRIKCALERLGGVPNT